MLCIRTFLTIYLAAINGGVVKAIVKRNFAMFARRCIFLMCYSLPSSMVNSSLEYLNKKLSVMFRQRLSEHFNQGYLSQKIYYQMTNLDSRISNAD